MRAKVLSSSGAPRDPVGADAMAHTEPAPMSVGEPEDASRIYQRIADRKSRDLDFLRAHVHVEVSNLWEVYQRVRDTMRNLESISEPHRTPRMNEITALAIVNVADLKMAIQALEDVPKLTP